MIDVTQAVRDAAADLLDELSSILDHNGIGQVADLIRDSEYDDHEAVKAFAKFEAVAYAAGKADGERSGGLMLEALREAKFELSQVDWRFAGVNLKATQAKIRAAIAAATEGGA